MQCNGSPIDAGIARHPCGIAGGDGRASKAGIPRCCYGIAGGDEPAFEPSIPGRPCGIIGGDVACACYWSRHRRAPCSVTGMNFTPPNASVIGHPCGAAFTNVQNPLATTVEHSGDYSDDIRSLESMLELPLFPTPTRSQQSFEPLIDYSHNILLTNHEYL